MGTAARIRHVASRVADAYRQKNRLVVVVSAMQGETDRLLALAGEYEKTPPCLREVDQLLATGEQAAAALLALALRALQVPARSLTAAQLRLYTDGSFSKARLASMDKATVQAALDAGEVVVATGFQGIDHKGNLTTLGRGGSDTSAVALAAMLQADLCEIYTDVRGVFTADPRICPDARKRDHIGFDEMLEMASLGAKVLQIRSVELAMNHGVPLRVRSTFDDDAGTLVGGEPPIERVNVVGISHSKNEAKVTLRGLDMGQGAVAAVFGRLAQAGVNVDVIVQNPPHDGRVDLSFTLSRHELGAAQHVLEAAHEALHLGPIEVSDPIGKVSIVGVGMMSHPGVAARMFQVLHEQGIGIELISTSEIKVTTVVHRDAVERAVVALHAAFGLDAKMDGRKGTAAAPSKTP